MATGIFFFFSLALTISIVFWTLRNRISPMPTSRKVKDVLLHNLPKDLKGNIIDLGSGVGTLVFLLARHYPKCSVSGCETSPVPYFISLIGKQLSRQKNAHLIRKDLFSTSLKNVSMVVCYLYPGDMKKLQNKFEQELQTGTWVISHTFAIPGWEPVEVFHVKDLYRTKIYFYKKR